MLNIIILLALASIVLLIILVLVMWVKWHRTDRSDVSFEVKEKIKMKKKESVKSVQVFIENDVSMDVLKDIKDYKDIAIGDNLVEFDDTFDIGVSARPVKEVDRAVGEFVAEI